MGAVVIENVRENRQAWLRARMQGIGASDSPKILGLSSWGGPISVYLEKTSDPDAIDDPEPSEAAELGLELEAWALRKCAEELGASSWALDGNLYRSEGLPWLQATIDGWIERHEVTRTDREDAEVKTTAFEERWGGEPPPDVLCQMQHQMAVRGTSRELLIVVFRVSGKRYRLEVERDDEFIEKTLLPALERFQDRVERRDPTGLELDAREATGKALARLFPQDPSVAPRVLPGEAMEWADELISVREQVKILEERKTGFQNKLRAAIGDAGRGVLPDGRYFNFKEQQIEGYTVAARTQRPLAGPFGGFR